MNSVKEEIALVERQAPEVWRLVYPRAYGDIGQWHSPKLPALAFSTAILLSREPRYEEAVRQSIGVLARQTAVCAEHQFPTYFVGSDLMSALLQTEPPLDMDIMEMNTPHRGLTFVLPVSPELKHPNGAAVPFITVTKHAPGEIDTSLDGRVSFNSDKGGLFITTMLLADRHPFLDWRFTFDVMKTVGDVYKISDYPTSLNNMSEILSGTLSVQPFETGEDDQTLGAKLGILAINLILTMTTRPALVTPGQSEGKRTKSGAQRWTPNVVGLNYRIRREGKGDGTHASPMMHWKCGHWKQQPYGPQFSLRKRQWIEPYMVGAQ